MSEESRQSVKLSRPMPSFPEEKDVAMVTQGEPDNVGLNCCHVTLPHLSLNMYCDDPLQRKTTLMQCC